MAKADKIPKDERVWVSYYSTGGETRFVITSKPSRETYFLYEISGDFAKKLGKSISPAELAEKFGVMKKL